MHGRDLTEKTLSLTRVFTGGALTIDRAEIELPDGRRSFREIVRHRGAAVILGQRPDGRFIFVRQYRRSVEQTLLETVAGCREEGEAFEDCARREMEEESGYPVLELTPLGMIYPCPGYCEEEQHLFYAKLAAVPQAQRPDFDENLDPVALTEEEIDQAIRSGALVDAKTIAIWFRWKQEFKK